MKISWCHFHLEALQLCLTLRCVLTARRFFCPASAEAIRSRIHRATVEQLECTICQLIATKTPQDSVLCVFRDFCCEDWHYARADPEGRRFAENGGGAEDRSRGSRGAKYSRRFIFRCIFREAVFIYARARRVKRPLTAPFAIVAVTKLREHWDETNSKVMQRKTQLDMMLGDSKEYEAKRNAVEVWLSRMETRLERMRAVGHTADVLAMQLEEQKVRPLLSSSLPRCSCS
jgi:hypothetical protein